MDNSVTVRVEQCVLQINLRAFFDAYLTKKPAAIKQLFRYVFQEPDRNEASIQAISEYLTAAVSESKADWHDAGVRYQNEYRLPDGQRNGIKTKNKELLDEVKRRKARHERLIKLSELFHTYQSKM